MTVSVRNAIVAAIGFIATGGLLAQSPGRLAPSAMRKAGKVDDRFQSYNVEMVEVTGGRFWAPYKKGAAAARTAAPASITFFAIPQAHNAACQPAR
ncbi:hypothetical protein [Paludibaculum fermentans]|uniref:hypothetical protein n=1 Tax=Paludibaculum fermentans TaxID=1473598 RepID=UPI003EC05BDE